MAGVSRDPSPEPTAPGARSTGSTGTPGGTHGGGTSGGTAGGSSESVMGELEAVLRSRLRHAPEGSYSARLLADPEAASRKIVEEAFEVALELVRSETDPRRVAEEAADVVFHLLVGLVGAGVGWEDVTAVLRERRR